MCFFFFLVNTERRATQTLMTSFIGSDFSLKCSPLFVCPTCFVAELFITSRKSRAVLFSTMPSFREIVNAISYLSNPWRMTSVPVLLLQKKVKNVPLVLLRCTFESKLVR